MLPTAALLCSALSPLSSIPGRERVIVEENLIDESGAALRAKLLVYAFGLFALEVKFVGASAIVAVPATTAVVAWGSRSARFQLL
jgi:hypothetical protein